MIKQFEEIIRKTKKLNPPRDLDINFYWGDTTFLSLILGGLLVACNGACGIADVGIRKTCTKCCFMYMAIFSSVICSLVVDGL